MDRAHVWLLPLTCSTVVDAVPGAEHMQHQDGALAAARGDL